MSMPRARSWCSCSAKARTASETSCVAIMAASSCTGGSRRIRTPSLARGPGRGQPRSARIAGADRPLRHDVPLGRVAGAFWAEPDRPPVATGGSVRLAGHETRSFGHHGGARKGGGAMELAFTLPPVGWFVAIVGAVTFGVIAQLVGHASFSYEWVADSLA